VRLWLNLRGKTSSELTADVALSRVQARGQGPLRFWSSITCAGGWARASATGRSSKSSAASSRSEPRPGSSSRPPIFGCIGRLPGGTWTPDAIELAPLARLAEYLPFPRAARARLAATIRAQRARLESRLDGRRGDPQHYSVRGGFARLARRPRQDSRIRGTHRALRGEREGRNVVLGSERVAIELPGLSPRAVAIRSLAAHVAGIRSGSIRSRLDTLSFANSDIAGTLFGRFARGQGGAGAIDLTGNFFRAEGRTIYRYIPLLPGPVVEYLKASIRKGTRTTSS